jgi:CDP-diglyceride synthetase
MASASLVIISGSMLSAGRPSAKQDRKKKLIRTTSGGLLVMVTADTSGKVVAMVQNMFTTCLHILFMIFYTQLFQQIRSYLFDSLKLTIGEGTSMVPI